MQKKLFRKSPAKIKNMFMLTFYGGYLFSLQWNAGGSFLHTCINFVDQRPKLSLFDGSIIA